MDNLRCHHARHIWGERRRSPWVVCVQSKTEMIEFNAVFSPCYELSVPLRRRLSWLWQSCRLKQFQSDLSWCTFISSCFFFYVKFKEEGKHTCGGVDEVCSSHSSASSSSVSTAGRLSDRSATDNSVQSPIISITCNKDPSRAQTWWQNWSVPLIPWLPDIWDSWREINQVVTDLNKSSKLSQSWETRAAEKRQSKHTNVSCISAGDDDLTENLFKVDSITLFSCIKCTSKVTTEEKCSVDKNDGKMYSEGRKT